jgi:hypothetical protein
MQELMIALEEQDVFVKGVDLEVQVSANTRPREEIGVFWGTIKAYVREIA